MILCVIKISSVNSKTIFKNALSVSPFWGVVDKRFFYGSGYIVFNHEILFINLLSINGMIVVKRYSKSRSWPYCWRFRLWFDDFEVARFGASQVSRQSHYLFSKNQVNVLWFSYGKIFSMSSLKLINHYNTDQVFRKIYAHDKYLILCWSALIVICILYLFYIFALQAYFVQFLSF